MQIISEGGAPGGHNPPGHARAPRRALGGCGPHVGPLTYLFFPHHSIHPEKNHYHALSRVLAPETMDLIYLLEAPFMKLFQEFVAWYVTPPCVQLVFALVVYILNN